MEGNIRHTNICSQILNNEILARAYNILPPDLPKIAQFTMKQSKKLSDNLMISSNYNYDVPKKTIKQDIPIQNTKYPKTHLLPLKPSTFSRQILYRTSMNNKQRVPSLPLIKDQAISTPSISQLIPLEPIDNYDQFQYTQQQQVQQKLRERKVHQHFLRTKYLQNLKQGVQNKMKRHINTNNNKSQGKNQMIIYDFNGNIIIPNNQKIENYKYNNQHHFLDLEINVVQKNDRIAKDIKRKIGKPKSTVQNNSYHQSYQSLKKVESVFLRDIENMRLSDGVQIKQSKQECRKILGYQGNETSLKRYVDLLKTNDKPIQIKFQDLQIFKAKMSSGEKPNQSELLIKPKQVKKFNLMSQKSLLSKSNKMKQIKVANTNAIQLLISDQTSQFKKISQSEQFNKKLTKKARFMM